MIVSCILISQQLNSNRTQTYMNRHVEVIRLEGIGHVSKCLEGVAPAGLLKSKSNSGFTTFL